jgi:WD40 repeat protein
MDIIEITNPMCIATCSLDRTIRLFNIQDKFLLAVLKGHETGVRNMAYTNYKGGYLVSAGHESYVNVWGPETAANKPFLGKL